MFSSTWHNALLYARNTVASGQKSRSTPIPEHTILGLKEPDYAPSVEEQIEFRDKGYLVAAGSILWVAWVARQA